MQDNKRIYLFFFSLLYAFCAILFFISGFLPIYNFRVWMISFNYLFFGGGFSCLFNSILLFIFAYNLKYWQREKYLRYLRPIIIIGIAIIAFFIIVLSTAGLWEYIINVYSPFETRIYNLERHILSFEGSSLGLISTIVLTLVTFFVIINYLSVYQNDYIAYQEKKQEKKNTNMLLFSSIYLICSILFFIAGFLHHPELLDIELDNLLNYLIIVGGVLYFTISFLLFYSTFKRKNWIKDKYFNYLKAILIIAIVTTAYFTFILLIFLINESFSRYLGGIETYFFPWLYEGYILGTYSLIILALLTIFLFFYFIILNRKSEVEYYQKY
ncbi:MAG: hypothetical protein ACFFAT_12065 [Promethearchaeota archaeon]